MTAKQNKRLKLSTESAPSWRGIKQDGKLSSTSAAARQKRFRQWGRWTLWGLAALVLLSGLVYALYFSGKQLAKLNPAPVQNHLARVEFTSDGVLNRGWFLANHPIPERTPTLGYDIFGLKARLEAHGQIMRAEVSVAQPSTLIVRVEERVPIMRARVRGLDGNPVVVLVAADGSVFRGEGYPSETLRRLPGLADVTPVWRDGEIQPFAGVEVVAELLEFARFQFPALYADWQWVSFARLQGDTDAPDALITIKSRLADRIVFAPHSFDPQLRKLNEVVQVAREENVSRLLKIDLSFPNQAIVEYP